MRAQVHGLLANFPRSLVAAPPDVCDFCADVVPDENDRFLLGSASRPDRLLINGARAGKWAKKRGAHVLHGHGLLWLPLFAAAQMASGVPLVITLHNLVPDDLSAAQKRVLQIAVGRAAHLIAVSQAVAESARRILGAREKIIVVRNGVDTNRFNNPNLPTRPVVRALLGLAPSDLAVICIARLSPEKGVVTLLQAASLLKGERRMRVFIVGDGPQKRELQNVANEYGLNDIVQFLGTRSDVPALLQGADVYVQPSHKEGLGIAVMEAMAAGLPVVAMKVGGLPEVIADNETGLLTEPQNPAAFAFALQTLLSITKKRESMGHAGRERVCSCFSVERMVKETQAVYEAVLAQRGAAK